MRRVLFIILVTAITVLFYLWSPFQPESPVEELSGSSGELLLPQRNVVIAALNLESADLEFTNPADLISLRALQDDFIHIDGVSKVDSILNATRVISQYEDIIVEKAVPGEDNLISESYLEDLVSSLDDFPELSPYINSTAGTLLFYIYFGNKVPSIEIHRDFVSLKAKWADVFPFEFTGKAPIISETESLLTKDIVLFFPILAIMVIIVFSLFRSLKAVVASIFLIVLSIAVAYGFVRFIGIPDSPLLLLIPIFSLGLLSDYLIHYFYHQLHSDKPDGQQTLRKLLLFPLTLTAISTILGFLSLSLINGSGHLQLGILIAFAVIVTWLGVFFWLDYGKYPPRRDHLLAGFQESQGRLFAKIAKIRWVFFVLIIAATAWGASQLNKMSIEPYPIQQLPDSTTIKQADIMINEEFYGTLPFFMEFDTGEANAVLRKDTLLMADKIHNRLEEENTGYEFSLLTVLKRINYYFMGSEDSMLTSTEFDDFYDALITQYLLYYSSSVDPQEYESLLDSSYRFFSVKGLLYYRDYSDLSKFYNIVAEIEGELPEGWSVEIHGMAAQLETEHRNLRQNWVLSFLIGGLLIFITVLIFYRKFMLALISLIPAVISMLISFGFISLLGISVDAFSIIFVAIITGLVIDYSIHTLVALDQIKQVTSLEQGFSKIIGYSGIPIFLSFLTSLISFSVLFLSSFKGARNLGFLLLTSLVLSFFLSLYLIPLIILPNRLKSEKQ